jgi:hypothetical protein
MILEALPLLSILLYAYLFFSTKKKKTESQLNQLIIRYTLFILF